MRALGLIREFFVHRGPLGFQIASSWLAQGHHPQEFVAGPLSPKFVRSVVLSATVLVHVLEMIADARTHLGPRTTQRLIALRLDFFAFSQ